MPQAELLLWKVYLQKEPRGVKRGDWQAGQVSKAIHDVALGFNGKQNPLELESYLLNFKLIDQQEILKQNLCVARGIFGKMVPQC
jgi:hypothetical protein